MNFDLYDGQRQLIDPVRRFTAERLRPLEQAVETADDGTGSLSRRA